MASAKKRARAPGLPRIVAVRGKKVVLDADLAALYGVEVRQLNQAVKRNADRFPDDFCFTLTGEEAAAMAAPVAARGSRSQTVILKSAGRGRHRKYLPRVFTEHGALMAANVLRSGRAIEMSLYLVRAFVEMREALLANVTILKRLAEIDRRLVEHDSVLREVIQRLQPLLDGADDEETAKPKIGFHQGNR